MLRQWNPYLTMLECPRSRDLIPQRPRVKLNVASLKYVMGLDQEVSISSSSPRDLSPLLSLMAGPGAGQQRRLLHADIPTNNPH